MITDSFYEKGYGHKVCQDYAIHGDEYVILADGCSSAPKTEIGAKLFVEMVRRHACPKNPHKPKKIAMDNAMYQCMDICETLDIPQSAMCCTLLISEQDKYYVNTRVFGDGCVVEKRKTGEIVIHNFSFPSGAPLYYYYSCGGLIDDYRQQHGNLITRTNYILDDEGFNIDFSETTEFFDVVNYVTTLKQDVEWVAICSDGVESFTKEISTPTSKTKENVQIADVVRSIFNFPAYRPNFLNNRMHWLKTKNKPDTFLSNKWDHYDDLSIGIIYLGEE